MEYGAKIGSGRRHPWEVMCDAGEFPREVTKYFVGREAFSSFGEERPKR